MSYLRQRRIKLKHFDAPSNPMVSFTPGAHPYIWFGSDDGAIGTEDRPAVLRKLARNFLDWAEAIEAKQREPR